MRIRKLQLLDNRKGWFDDAYAYENDANQVIFRYSFGWGRMGAFYNGQLKKFGASLENIESVIHPTQGLRWLPIEEVDDHQVDDYLADFNEAIVSISPAIT